MVYGVFKYQAPLECFAHWENGFNKEELEQVIFLEKLAQFEKGVTGNKKSPNQKVRDSDITWIHPNHDTDWLFCRIGQITSKVNQNHFMYDIEGFDSLQYTKYGVDQHYNWHWDVAFGWENYQRKISVVMMLSDPEDYEGGEFEICLNGNLDDIKSFKPKKGDILFFASWMPHRVKPVTSGTRKSLVTWIQGKRQS
jgi:PKHD-type hydroxylase